MEKPKIVRHQIFITESQVKLYGAAFIDNRIEDCKQDAINVAIAQKYKNPQVIQEVFIQEEPNNIDDSKKVINGWRQGTLPCRYIVTVEDVK